MSLGIPQFREQHWHVLLTDLADVLINDHALAIDNEGFRHAGRTQRDLYAAVHVRSDAGIRIARSEEHTSELQSLMRTSYAVFCLKKKTHEHSPSYINHVHTIIPEQNSST